eukprot:m.76739 g.76739  ORF g.76739 m.76739 type:complete len:438 (+) comp13190_c0_seq2:76-1389(+)
MHVRRMIRGTIVHCTAAGLSILEDAVIGAEASGKIAFVGSVQEYEKFCKETAFSADEELRLTRGQFVMPGLIDCHTHAPQYVFTGTGSDLPLLDWLNKYTFPTEARFADLSFAREAYKKNVGRLVRHGTTTACYFGSIHEDGTAVLVETVAAAGQRALVGKVCMDRHAPPYYIETTADSLQSTRSFIEHVRGLKNPLIQPIITPRFVPTCTSALMAGLGQMAAELDVHIQSHLSENKAEIEWVRELHPEAGSYSDVYDAHGLLTPKTIMAHCIHLSESEAALLRTRGTAVIHCPNSNFSICSGVMDIRRAQEQGLTVGLGTDVSGGCSPSMLDAIRQAITASKVIAIQRGSAPLTLGEALTLATLGGAKALGMHDQLGNFEPGKQFDALIVDGTRADSPFSLFPSDSLEDIVSKFIFLGDDRNVVSVFVANRLIHSH